jgi:LysR family glycine cleavage system transcriptional activator
LQVTTTPNFTANWLAPRLADFRRRHPDVELMINPSPQVAKIGPGGYDVAIRSCAGTEAWPGLIAERLLPTGFAIVAAPSLLAGRKITEPADLLDLPWLQELGTDEVTQWLGAHGVTAARVPKLMHLPGNYTLDAVRAGAGVGVIATAFAAHDIAEGRLTALFEEALTASGYYLVTAPGVQRPPLRAFAAWLRRQAADGRAQGQAVADRVTVDASHLRAAVLLQEAPSPAIDSESGI